MAADKTHRGHAIIEQVHADLKSSALAHLASGKFTANAAWLVLVVIAFNLTRTAATIASPDLARATTATIRAKLITVPAQVATSARPVTLRPTDRLALAERLDPPVHPPVLGAETSHGRAPAVNGATRNRKWNTLTGRSGNPPCPQATTKDLGDIGSPHPGCRRIEAKHRRLPCCRPRVQIVRAPAV